MSQGAIVCLALMFALTTLAAVQRDALHPIGIVVSFFTLFLGPLVLYGGYHVVSFEHTQRERLLGVGVIALSLIGALMLIRQRHMLVLSLHVAFVLSVIASALICRLLRK